jgi:ketosteroid isomerase-like protein
MGSDVQAVAHEPEELERLFVERVNAGDVEGLVALFEPDALVAHAPGEVAVGTEAIRRMFQEMVATGEHLTLGDQQPSLRVGDLALGSTRLADGGVTAEVARRQADGSWRWIIDRWNILAE